MKFKQLARIDQSAGLAEHKLTLGNIILKTVESLDDDFIEKFHQTIGKNVKKLRERKGYSQLVLSQTLGYKSVGLISQAEIYHKGQHFNLEHLLKIAHVLECHIEDFFQESVGE
ncbi:helix-turn-helix domain-containing protein [Sulfurospirillum arsenophilum]|uniref:helix-turn-helix domain-containing protein n=1 Tax=Sulfurospirillum arsenophilum TaxID=56698 RepID=UPI0012EB85B9|nr:helix-turn-helix transcriptional regulator [Sulfurospirillum arsenophilum]